jgi:hypothetical protein
MIKDITEMAKMITALGVAALTVHKVYVTVFKSA